MPRAARLAAARDFEELRAAPYRTSARWVGLTARMVAADVEGGARVRIGITAGKRMARKAVQRNLVKRILREAARHALPALKAAAGALQVDLGLRLKSAFPSPRELPLAAFKRALRDDADALLLRLIRHLEAQS